MRLQQIRNFKLVAETHFLNFFYSHILNLKIQKESILVYSSEATKVTTQMRLLRDG